MIGSLAEVGGGNIPPNVFSDFRGCVCVCDLCVCVWCIRLARLIITYADMSLLYSI